MKKKYKRILFLVIFLILFFACFFHTKMVCEAIIHYTKLFFYNLFPSAFIFLLLSQLLFEYQILQVIQKVVRSKYLCFFLISLMSGFPSGAVFIKKALERDEITIFEANEMIQFAHFPNPLFVLYQASILFPHSILCYVFYFIIFFSNFLLLISKPQPRSVLPSSIENSPSFSKTLIHCARQTISIIFTIYTSSLFFYLISCFLCKYFVFHSTIYVFINGLLDLTNGVVMLSILTNSFIQGVFFLFFIVFGSIPIHIQIHSILEDSSISYKSFLKGRMKSFLFSILIWIIYSYCALWIS